MVALLADAALGYCLVEPDEGTSDALAISTASLAVDSIASAGEGDWIGITLEGLRTGSKPASAQTPFHYGDRLIAHTNAILAVLDGHV